ncbi:hypothetical protein TNCV_5046301 [Trichonephila clavipes]|uniref:Uncharacterized protein n=1 Tax=Trichonephila clavipes TaxID=2585209 RepID=A0A8X6WJI0_TRICX|nr:hypothetical protein TNCV_5046301 [Trichonephila clavipes]
MIGELEENLFFFNLPYVAEEFGIVSRARKAYQMTCTIVRKVGGGLARKTIATDDRYIILGANRDWNQTSGNLAELTGITA